MEISGSGWTCPYAGPIWATPPIVCSYHYYSPDLPYPHEFASAYFEGSQLQPDFAGVVEACSTDPSTGCLTTEVTITMEAYYYVNCSPYPYCWIGRAGETWVVQWPCSPTPPPIVLFQPAEGAFLENQCTTLITGIRYSPTTENIVTIDLDGDISTVPVDENGNFSKDANISTGSHTVTASNSQGSDTHTFTSTCCQGSDPYSSTSTCQYTTEFEFPEPEKDAKVLTHKFKHVDDTTEDYPKNQSTDGEIKIQAKVVDASGKGVNGQDVWFRVKTPDPADGLYNTMTYRSDRGPDDNKGGKATLSLTGPVQTVTVVIDGKMTDGIAETVLRIPGSANNPESPAFGGDNYWVEVSTKSDFSEALSTSGTVTAWKKAYAENAKMYKVGGFLTAASSPGGTQTVLSVKDGNKTFSKNDRVHIFSAAEVPTDKSPLIGERAVVVSNPTATSITVQRDENGDGVGDGFGLRKAYKTAGNSDACKAVLPYTFVAKANSASDYYNVVPKKEDTEKALSTAFNDAYVEWLILDYGYFMPSWTDLTLCANSDAGRSDFIEQRSPWYFQNYDVFSGPVKNHVQLAAAGEFTTDDRFYGKTSAKNVAGPGPNWSWIFMRTVMDKYSKSADWPPVRDNIIAHELGHEWNVNGTNPLCNKPGELPDCGHDGKNACKSGSECLMNEARDRKAGVVRFHCDDTNDPKDLYCIRGHVDDTNQDACGW